MKGKYGFNNFTSINDLIENRARETPHKHAMIFIQYDNLDNIIEESINYKELEAQSKKIAYHLSLHSDKGDRVLILCEPGLDFIYSFFGCLFAGVIAVPSYIPYSSKLLNTLKSIIEDAQLKLVLSTDEVRRKLLYNFSNDTEFKNLNIITIEDINNLTRLREYSDNSISSDTIAFLQYTSGSTSQPKGVLVSHGNLLDNQQVIYNKLGHSKDTRIVSWLPPYHDMGLIYGIMQSIYGNIPAYLFSPLDFLTQPFRWLHAVSKYKATSSGAPNFAYELCMNKIIDDQKETLDLSNWKTAFNGAEPVRADTINRFSECFKSCGFKREAFYPCYGLAESTLMVSGGSANALPVIESFNKQDIENNKVLTISSDSKHSTKIVGCGNAFQNETILIVDPDTRIVKEENFIGEIWLKSPSVAKGYWNNSDATEKTFRAYTDKGDGPFLRTGDFGFLRNEELFVTGRIKDLIIIRGKNYYPQDIELTIENVDPFLRKGNIAAFSIDIIDDEQLVLVAELKQEAVNLKHNDIQNIVNKIIANIAMYHELDVYQVVLIKAGSMPKTSSGKIRRAICKQLFLSNKLQIINSYVSDSFKPRKNRNEIYLENNVHEINRSAKRKEEVEEQLCNIWREILKLEYIGLNDSFFELGGHSLRVASLISMIHKEFQVKISIKDVFRNPCIKKLAELIRKSEEVKYVPIEPVAKQEHYMQSSSQKRLYFLNQLMDVGTTYNISAAFRINGSIDKGKIHSAFLKLIKRHESLRTSFDMKHEIPVQILHEDVDFEIETINVQAEINDSVITNYLANFIRPFDPKKAPLFRVGFLNLADTDHIIVIDIDHKICDGISINILLRDFMKLYKEEALPPIKVQYKDFTVWQNRLMETEIVEKQARYWIDRFSGELPVLELPTDYPRPSLITFDGDRYNFELDRSLIKNIREVASRNGATMYMILLAVYTVLLSKYSKQEDIIIGSPTAGRNHANLDNTIGMFLNTIAMRNFPKGDMTFDAFLSEVKKNTLDAFDNQDYQFDNIVNHLQLERDLSRNPIFDVTFVLQNMEFENIDLDHVICVPYKLKNLTSKYDLGLSCVESDEIIRMELEYNVNLFTPKTILNMCRHFVNIVREIVADPAIKIKDISLLSLENARALISEYNNTKADYPRDKTIVELFEEQVKQTPDNVALSGDNIRLTYQELNEKSNQLARLIRNEGIKPNNVVCLMAERSPEMIFGILGILKAGGAYLLIDPEYPADRIKDMLEDSKSTLLLTQIHLADKVKYGIKIIDLNDEAIEIQEKDNMVDVLESNNLLYVIYTSGSTGKPKGVMITHRNGINLLYFQFNKTNIPFIKTKIVQFASISFDVSFQEIFSALLSGGELILISDSLRKDMGGYFSLVEKNAVEIVYLPISYIKLIFSEEDNIKRFPKSVKYIIIGGDQLIISNRFRDFIKERGIFVYNHYGPSETHVVTTLIIDPNGEIPTIPPIGKPISNTEIYILSENKKVQPVGVVGEIYISGDCVGKGYLNNKDLTSEKFIENPFVLGEIMYCSGDQARWLPDGNIEFMGRIDRQVKIRGYRVELGEIEAVLLENEAVKNAAVVAHKEKNGNKALVAHLVLDYEYLLADTEALIQKWKKNTVSEWRDLFNYTWEKSSAYKDKKFNLTGWNSSYTDEPISEEEMMVWVDDTVETILSFNPDRVLEIGCGAGLILSRVAPQCKAFIGTDFSEDSIRYCYEQLVSSYKELSNVKLLHQEADNFMNLKNQRFNAIILNSIIQYFPNIEYLERVLEGALQIIEPGGFIFLGDVRSYPLMKAFHTSVQLFKAESDLILKELRDRISFQMNEEMEFFVDPEYFLSLKNRFPIISHISVFPKRGRYHNELTKFRYQVIIYTDSQIQSNKDLVPVWLDWQKDIGSVLDLFSILKDRKEEIIGVKGIPGARLFEESLSLRLMDRDSEVSTVGQLREIIRRSEKTGVEIDDIYKIAIKSGYSAAISWIRQKEENCYDIIFKLRHSDNTPHLQGVPMEISDYITDSKPLSEYANIPMKGKLFRHIVPELRSYLQRKLPDYMIPSYFMQLESMPLTSTGKIDRKSLPAPDYNLTRSSNYVLPEDETEVQVARIWEKLLGIDRIGIHDTFFEIGGDSIKAIQIVNRLEVFFDQKIPIMTLFQYPTIKSIAEYLNRQKPEELKVDNKIDRSMELMENTLNVLGGVSHE